MPRESPETLADPDSSDVVAVRQTARKYADQLGFSLVDQTKLVTAASELARNTLDYGGGGTARLEILENGTRRGVRLTFEDRGPGIPDITQALKDGFTTGTGLGLGLGGARRSGQRLLHRVSALWRHPGNDSSMEVSSIRSTTTSLKIEDQSTSARPGAGGRVRRRPRVR